MALRQTLIGLCVALQATAAAAQAERFAVLVGNDLGQPPDVPLSYAETDATRMAAALQEVGGVRPENLVLLTGRDAPTVRRTLIAVNDRVRAAGHSAVLIVYYSGHADAASLHLGATPLELPELEQLVRGSAATFRLLIVDACRSGALTRVKGGAPIPPFDIRMDERSVGEGAVFLTSSSASEESQESDEIKGSFFSHALISALLGAGDADGDGRVTLDEAYRYSYAATLRASSRTLAGLQHPTFQYELRGAGELVLATLDTGSPSRARVELPPGRTWLLFQGSEQGAVVAEVGAADPSRRLSLRAGRYFVRGRGADVLLEGAFDALPGATIALEESRLRKTEYARLVRKGGGAVTAVSSVEASARFRSSLAGDAGACAGIALGLSIALRPFTLSPRVAWCRSGFSSSGLSATVDEYDLEISLSHVWDLSVLSLDVGLTAGGSVLTQRFRTSGEAPGRTTGALQLSPSAGLTRELGGRTYGFLAVSGATFLFRTQDSSTSRTSFGPSFALRASFGMGFRL
ncbi:MAG TPA: caspase family protein [Myxococcales bacterium]|nr:caspase family protein [Myxococcales bacterium]